MLSVNHAVWGRIDVYPETYRTTAPNNNPVMDGRITLLEKGKEIKFPCVLILKEIKFPCILFLKEVRSPDDQTFDYGFIHIVGFSPFGKYDIVPCDQWIAWG